MSNETRWKETNSIEIGEFDEMKLQTDEMKLQTDEMKLQTDELKLQIWYSRRNVSKKTRDRPRSLLETGFRPLCPSFV